MIPKPRPPRPPRPPMRYPAACWHQIENSSNDLRVRRAVIETPGRAEIQGVVILNGLAPKLILQLDDAYELAEALASVLDTIAGIETERELIRPAEADQILEANMAEAFTDEPAGEES